MATVILLCLLCVSSICMGQSHSESKNGALFLTPLIKRGELDTARNLSNVDPTLFSGVESYSGYITVNEEFNSNTFFWYFPAQIDNKDGETPLLVWLHGGPGVSSMYGLFTEAGPLKIENNATSLMNVTWSGNYSILFIENPVGTGFSFTQNPAGYAADEDQVGSELLSFMRQFLQVFPALRTSPTFLVGSSYAGKFIPALAWYIMGYNRNCSTEETINLKGLVMGNPWIDPPNIRGRGTWAFQVGLVDNLQAEEISHHEDLARNYLENGQFDEYANESLVAYTIFANYAGVNTLNFLRDPSDGLLGISEEFIAFLNREDVQSAIHTGRVTYEAYNSTVEAVMARDNWDTVRPWLEELLEEEYGVMVYSGQLDMTIPYGMAEPSYQIMHWKRAKEYRHAVRKQLLLDDSTKKLIGYVKSGGNFVDVLVRNAAQ